MKFITALFFINFSVFVFASGSEGRKIYPYDYYDYGKYRPCAAKAGAKCVPSDELFKKTPANEQELHTYCKLKIPYVKCYDEEFGNCLGFNPYKYEHAFYTATLRKACDKNSEWHKALIKHLPCAEKEITSYDDVCPAKIDEIAKAVAKVRGLDWDKLENFDYTTKEERDQTLSFWCFYNILLPSCLQMKIENCGTEAGNLSLEIIKSLSYYTGACNEADVAPYYSAIGDIGLKDQEVKTIRKISQIWFENFALFLKNSLEE